MIYLEVVGAWFAAAVVVAVALASVTYAAFDRRRDRRA